LPAFSCFGADVRSASLALRAKQTANVGSLFHRLTNYWRCENHERYAPEIRRNDPKQDQVNSLTKGNLFFPTTPGEPHLPQEYQT
jgi:hypothetical protein